VPFKTTHVQTCLCLLVHARETRSRNQDLLETLAFVLPGRLLRGSQYFDGAVQQEAQQAQQAQQQQQQQQQQRDSQAAKDAALSGSSGLDLGSLSRIAIKPAAAAAPPAAQHQQQQQQQQHQLGALSASSAQESQAMAALYAGMATSQACSCTPACHKKTYISQLALLHGIAFFL
jgi:hypothetical protein